MHGHGMRPGNQKIENCQISLDVIWCIWVILGVESEFRVILLFFSRNNVKNAVKNGQKMVKNAVKKWPIFQRPLILFIPF